MRKKKIKFVENKIDLFYKKHFASRYQIFRFFPLKKWLNRFFRKKRRKELKYSKKVTNYRILIKNFINAPVRHRKKKKSKKNLKILKWIYRNNWKKKFFKKIKILQKIFIQYFGNLSIYTFKRIALSYRVFNNITKFEKFFYYFEFRLPIIIVRIKFIKNYYQAIKFICYGGVRVNGIIISYVNFLVYLFDLIELAYRFYRYGYSKRYIKYKKYFRRIRRRSYFIRHYKRYIYKSFLKKKRLFLFNRPNYFFEKNRRFVGSIILHLYYKYKYRKFNKYFNFKNLSLIMSFT
jgi:ribosomal protein S4